MNIAEKLNSLTAEEIADYLQSANVGEAICPYPAELLQGELRRAAVLLPLVREADEWHLLFIRRSANERDRHSGQVAFAGGKEESQDRTLVETALREAEEEIGPHWDPSWPFPALKSRRCRFWVG